MKFLKTAYLPKNEVALCVAGSGINPFKNELLKLGINIIETYENTKINKNIANHADLALNYFGNGKAYIDQGQIQLINSLKAYDIDYDIIDETVQGKYPNDCLLNCIITDQFLLCNKLCTSEKLLKFASQSNKRIINVNQGYVKCSVCVVSENAFITDDESIYNRLSAEDLDVLLVKKGSVRLNGFNYGFIGGCSSKISEKIIAFTGDIRKHSCYYNIKSFAKNYGVDLLSLSNTELTDIGSIIPIIEKE